MADLGTVKIPMSEVVKDITVNIEITGEKVFWARFWFAKQLIKLAALAAGCGIRIENADDFADSNPPERNDDAGR